MINKVEQDKPQRTSDLGNLGDREDSCTYVKRARKADDLVPTARSCRKQPNATPGSDLDASSNKSSIALCTELGADLKQERSTALKRTPCRQGGTDKKSKTQQPGRGSCDVPLVQASVRNSLATSLRLQEYVKRGLITQTEQPQGKKARLEVSQDALGLVGLGNSSAQRRPSNSREVPLPVSKRPRLGGINGGEPGHRDTDLIGGPSLECVFSTIPK